jgi:hypothetical protein
VTRFILAYLGAVLGIAFVIDRWLHSREVNGLEWLLERMLSPAEGGPR